MPDKTSAFRTIEIGSLPCPVGQLHQVTVKSSHLKGRADCSVYLPAQVSQTTATPIVILLHGVYGSHWAWNLKGNAYKTLQSLIDAGHIPPMILATPSDGLWGDGSGYFQHSGKNFEAWITQDVPQIVKEVIEDERDASLYIAGLSMGGYGALRIGAKYPEIFSAFAGHSSITAFEQMQLFTEEPAEDYRDIKTNPLSLIDTIRETGSALRPFRFDCGTGDLLIEPNRILHQELKAAGIPHEYQEYPGGHDWDYWSKHLETTLRFFGKTDPALQK